MQLSSLIRGERVLLAVALALGLGSLAGGARAAGLLDGFGNFDWKEFFTLHNKDKDGKDGATGSKDRHVFCPEIMVLEGTAAARVHAGAPATNMNLRYQYSVGDVVRECAVQGDQLAIRIGVEGNVLLGPAGAPAAFSVPLRVAIVGVKDHEPVVSKLYHVAATIPAGEAQTDFSLVTEPLLVPFIQDHAEDDYSIKIGIDDAAPAEKPAARRKP
jgi:hypothetical protein